MGDIITASGTRIYISGSAVASTVDTLAEFEAITVWTEIGMVENLGEYGDESQAVTGAVIGDSRTRKAKGARDAGTVPITVFHDPLDAGQAAMEAAEGTNDNYAFKVVIPDSPTASYSDTIEYFRGLVMSKRKNIGTNDNIVRKTYNVGINSEIFSDPAST